MYNLSNSSECIDMPRDEVSIDASLSSDTTFDVELVASFFVPKIGPRKTLDHRKERIRFRGDICQRHTDSIVCDTLSDREGLICESILYNKGPSIRRDDTRCGFDNSGEHKSGNN